MAYLLQQLLAVSARRYPQKEAVVFKDQSLTYKQLDEASTQLAHLLLEGGVEKGDRVGIYIDKSLESVVSIFGIMKAGAVYVPIDPSAPVKRVSYIIGNCGMKALVSSKEKILKLSPALDGNWSLQCVVLTDRSVDGVGSDAAGPSATVLSWKDVLSAPLQPPATPSTIEDDLAYILYTSGSTGEPKGVMISHRASLTFVDWSYEYLEVHAQDRLSNHAPLHFDLSIFDIFTAIKAGATLILVPPELSAFPRNLAAFIEKQRISIWYSVPSVLTSMVLSGGLEDRSFPHLRKILFAGEVFPVKYLRQLKELVPGVEYYNLYGPTETNVCTFFKVAEIPADRVEPFPIGRACENTETFVINDRLEIAAKGEVGELYVRGPSLMKGYWGMQSRTEKVLVSHPAYCSFWDQKAYKTGDLVREDEEGNYVFLGRRDNQIKSRGYRIELGEIETALYAHPDVEEVAVLAIPDELIGNTIKAVIAARDGSEITVSEVARFCSDRIPAYMIPSLFEFRPSLPKISTGKIDKTLLTRQHQESRSA